MSWDKFICQLFWGIFCSVNGVQEKREKFPKILNPIISNIKYRILNIIQIYFFLKSLLHYFYIFVYSFGGLFVVCSKLLILGRGEGRSLFDGSFHSQPFNIAGYHQQGSVSKVRTPCQQFGHTVISSDNYLTNQMINFCTRNITILLKKYLF